jgi:DNA-binding NarL/FixJ family response regulator
MKPTLIIVDDIKAVREKLNAALASSFEVLGLAASGAEAIQLCRTHAPELVLMDLVMPQMSGIEATEQIVVGATPPKVVVLSALQDENTVLRAFEAGASEFLVKPVSEKKIREVLLGLARRAA